MLPTGFCAAVPNSSWAGLGRGVKSPVEFSPKQKRFRPAVSPRGVDLAVVAPLSPPHSHVVPHLTNEV